MTDRPKQPVAPKADGLAKPAVPAGQKTFDFSKEDQDFLQPRQVLINQKKLEIADIDFSMQQYIIQNVLPRLSIDATKYIINYNVSQNKVTATPKPPEILVPPKDIVIPKGVVPAKPKN